ncbi:MAG: arsenite methyltransferase [Ignavibacteria bacterium]|nr:arsenite methyltransferase [Ignavibacteria bacterium]
MEEKLKKEIVKEKYSDIATKSGVFFESPCCGPSSCCSSGNFDIMAEDYSKIEGYVPEADLSLGCGLPTEFALINDGDTVVDLGSGAGNDVFIARAITGEKGRVIGIDFTEEMIEKAKLNNKKLGYDNIEFIYGDIENLPLDINTSDVVISNCVLNLVPDKEKAFSEIYRILKPGGHFSVSDIVTTGELPESIKKVVELYAGCVSGATTKDEYIKIIEKTGFKIIKIQKERIIEIPNYIYLKYISKEELTEIKKTGLKILSINVYAEKFLPVSSGGNKKQNENKY